MKSSNNNLWRVETYYVNGETRESLTAPGYHIQRDREERVAIPKKVSGPFIICDNGYGTIQILSETDRRVFCCIEYKSTNHDNLTCEEALWMAHKIVEALNKE